MLETGRLDLCSALQGQQLVVGDLVADLTVLTPVDIGFEVEQGEEGKRDADGRNENGMGLGLRPRPS